MIGAETVTLTVVDIVGSIIGLCMLFLGIRKLEFLFKGRRSKELTGVYNRIGALELSASAQRSEVDGLTKSYDELREGCQDMEKRLEVKVDDCVVRSAKAENTGDVIMKLVKVNKNA